MLEAGSKNLLRTLLLAAKQRLSPINVTWPSEKFQKKRFVALRIRTIYSTTKHQLGGIEMMMNSLQTKTAKVASES